MVCQLVINCITKIQSNYIIIGDLERSHGTSWLMADKLCTGNLHHYIITMAAFNGWCHSYQKIFIAETTAALTAAFYCKTICKGNSLWMIIVHSFLRIPHKSHISSQGIRLVARGDSHTVIPPLSVFIHGIGVQLDHTGYPVYRHSPPPPMLPIFVVKGLSPVPWLPPTHAHYHSNTSIPKLLYG